MLLGPHTCVPLGHLCKKQGAVFHSSSEAEVIALEVALRTEVISALMLWDLVIEVGWLVPYDKKTRVETTQGGVEIFQALQQEPVN